MIGGIQDEFATVEKIATVPGMFKHVDAGEVMRLVKVVWQDSDSPKAESPLSRRSEGTARAAVEKPRSMTASNPAILKG